MSSEKLEPGIGDLAREIMADGAGPDMPDRVALMSIAISLKRIADAITYQPGPENLFDIVRSIKSAPEGHGKD